MAKDSTAQIRRMLCRRCAAQGIPVSGVFELTPRCNLRCKMCYVRLTPAQMAPIGRELTREEWLSLARGAREAGMTFLLITGGEPTLRPDFPEIYEELAQMGFSISINTNGTLLTPRIRELWHRLPPAMVNVTLYGTCREDYDALCGEPEAFDRVSEGLRWLKQEGILLHLNTTIAPENAERWLSLEEYARSLELELRMTVYCFPPSRQSECGQCVPFRRITAEQAAELMVRDILYREGPDALMLRAQNLSEPPREECDLETGDPMQCMAGRSQFWMTWDGRMTPCGMLSQPQTRPLELGFADAWKNLNTQTREIRLCPECAACPDEKTCMNCAAVVWAETGTFDQKPDYMCRLNRAYRQLLADFASGKNIGTEDAR